MEADLLLVTLIQQIAELRLEINSRLDKLDVRTRTLEVAPGKFIGYLTLAVAVIAACVQVIIRFFWR